MSRLNKLRMEMEKAQLDAFLVTSPENRRYISGFTGTSAMCLIFQDKAYLLTDFRYIEQAKAQAPDFEIIKTGRNPYETVKELIGTAKSMGIEEDYMTLAEYQKLKKELPNLDLKEQAKSLKNLRAVKETEEIEKIKKAVKIADSAFQHILNYVEVGLTEEEIALELEFYMRKAGAGGPSFDFIAASGKRSALPHGVASPKKVQEGDLLTLDYGCIYEGYCSDITRTIVFGEPSEKQQEIYEIVLKAQEAGIAAVKPGVKGKEVDQVARKIIEDAGYGEYFGHGLGHSVGLAIHEGPNLSISEETVLEPGMVVTVEPGIYLPGWGGVRIEDMVVVTRNGCQVLTQAPKQFIIIE